MIQKIKDHMKQPLTYGWYYKNVAISAIVTAVIYGVICLIGYINSREGDDYEKVEME